MNKNYFFNKLYAFLSYFFFSVTGKSLKNTNQVLVNLYSKDCGLFMDNFHKLIGHKNKIKTKKSLSNSEKYHVINDLNENGYHILKEKIEEKKVSELTKLAFRLKCDNGISRKKFDPNNLTAVRYNFDKKDLIKNKIIQYFIMDESLIQIAREYFGSEPIFDMPAMWWSTPFKKEASSEAAQLYHYDCNGRVKWLKIFIYLTDVDENNGPHHYIKGTHKIGSKPKNLLSRGYVRISDEELKRYYPLDYFKEIKGSRGTAFAADTLCWHKGKNLITGNRLVFELNYTSSLFGHNSNKLLVSKKSQDLIKFCKNNPVYSKNFLFE